MTDKEDFFNKPCEKLSAACVDAFVELGEDPTNPANLVLTSSWGISSLDMKNIVKASETVTHLSLTDEALQYDREDGGIDCINGDALSAIISMQELKDVNKNVALAENMVYVWDGQQFTPQDISSAGSSTAALEAKVAQLQTSVSLLQTSNTELTQTVTTLQQNLATTQQSLTALEARVKALEDKENPPESGTETTNNEQGESNE